MATSIVKTPQKVESESPPMTRFFLILSTITTNFETSKHLIFQLQWDVLVLRRLLHPSPDRPGVYYGFWTIISFDTITYLVGTI